MSSDLEIYPTLADVPGPVDVVDVFRRSEAVPAIVDAAIARGDGCVWLQEGVVHEEAAARAARRRDRGHPGPLPLQGMAAADERMSR